MDLSTPQNYSLTSLPVHLDTRGATRRHFISNDKTCVRLCHCDTNRVPTPRGYHASLLADAWLFMFDRFNGRDVVDDIHMPDKQRVYVIERTVLCDGNEDRLVIRP